MKRYTYVLKNIGKRKTRTIFISLWIAASVTASMGYVIDSVDYRLKTIAPLTGSIFGHLQIHKKGYMANRENLPLDKNFTATQILLLLKKITASDHVSACSARLKFGGYISNFKQYAGIRLNGVDPEMEKITLPLFSSRVNGDPTIKKGRILVPEDIAKTLALDLHQTVLLVATNKDGYVNALNLTVSGFISYYPLSGANEAFIHIDDARRLLNIEDSEANEIVIRVNGMGNVESERTRLAELINLKISGVDTAIFELHDWKTLSGIHPVIRFLDITDNLLNPVLFGIIFIVVLFAMVWNFRERKTEIEMIINLGGQRKTLFFLFSLEGLFYGIIGLLAAIVLWLCVFLVGFGYTIWGGEHFPLSMMNRVWHVLRFGFISIVAATFAGIPSAVMAATIRPFPCRWKDKCV